ncbi:MAG: cytochrome [Bdellovibrionales bacterium]
MSAAKNFEEGFNTNATTVFIQGNLQSVFDALYYLGVIDPVLEMDWEEAMHQMPSYSDEVHSAIQVVNDFKGSGEELAEELKSFDDKTLGFLAMEVAREFADYHARKSLH